MPFNNEKCIVESRYYWPTSQLCDNTEYFYANILIKNATKKWKLKSYLTTQIIIVIGTILTLVQVYSSTALIFIELPKFQELSGR